MFLDDNEFIEGCDSIDEVYDSDSVYSRDGTDSMLENDEISATEEAFMNGWEEADTIEE